MEGKNTIICAPTNSGKTYVAIEIAKRHLDSYARNPDKSDASGKSLFSSRMSVIVTVSYFG